MLFKEKISIEARILVACLLGDLVVIFSKSGIKVFSGPFLYSTM